MDLVRRMVKAKVRVVYLILVGPCLLLIILFFHQQGTTVLSPGQQPSDVETYACPNSLRVDPNSRGHEAPSMDSGLQHQPFQNEALIQQLYHDTCLKHGPHVNIKRQVVGDKSVVLVVLFNNPYYSVIPYLELLYRPLFSEIIYCMPSNLNYRDRESIRFKVRIIYYEDNSVHFGLTNYICVYHAHNLNLGAEGYLFVADDVLLSLSIIRKLPLSSPATVHDLPSVCDMRRPDIGPCADWPHYGHASEDMRSFNNYYKKLPLSLPHQCLHRLQRMSGLEEPLIKGLADIYYIPKKYMTSASLLLKSHYEHRVFLEVAVPQVLTCLTLPSLPIGLHGYTEWTHQRELFYRWVPKVTVEGAEFLHPAKLSYVVKGNVTFIKSLCNEIIPYYHRDPTK